jgi:Spx/MgsR family transcriptional regulator
MKMYGIPNCSTVKKARAWLEARGIAYGFHDYKKLGVPKDVLRAIIKLHGWEPLINKSGPTWRKLPEQVKAAVKNAPTAIAVMEEYPSVIRRPIIDRDGHYQIGYSEENFSAFFGE